MSYFEYTIILGAVYSIAAISYQLVLNAGIMQACQAALVGIGAYAGAVATAKLGLSFPVAIAFAAAVTGVIGVPLSILSLRLGHFFLAVATLGFAQVVIALVYNSEYLGGAVAFSGHPLATGPVSVAIVLGATLLLALRLQNSRKGHAWRAVADDPVAAASLGIAVNRERVQVFVLGSVIAGAAGALLAHLTGIVDPTQMTFAATVTFLTMVVVGGITTPLGAVLGAALITALPEVLSFSDSARLLVYGVLIVAMMIFRPRGIVNRRRVRMPADRRAQAPAEGQAAPPKPVGALVPPSLRATNGNRSGELVASGIAKAFGGLQVLSDVTVSLAPGEVLGVIGPNGAGKTTLFNIVSGLETPDRGQVLLDGRDITKATVHRRARLGIARTFQHTRLFASMSCLENLIVARHAVTSSGVTQTALVLPSERRERRESVEAAADMLERIGLAHVADVPARELPYGLQRKLEMARALMCSPRFLLLDEPSAGMTDADHADLRSAIAAVAGAGVGVLLIEHNVPLVTEIADRMVVLSGGTLIATGAPRACLEDPGVIEAYLGSPLAA